ncbi:hypothetical protein F7725_001611 [Dissostichus mawsoni]|uniref:Uncharacterized protein n=1 Tax=Dissostichus mawsoni TaxID=36200 RepID=A0A7J5Y038_DISMA|nr:hypothetical protein F7725_001611 [Dissostichus mawsoni]
MSDREGVTECRIGMNGVMHCPSRSVLFLIVADLGSARVWCGLLGVNTFCQLSSQSPAMVLSLCPACSTAGGAGRVPGEGGGLAGGHGAEKRGEVEVERLELKHKFVWGEGEQPDHLRATLSLLCPFTWRAALNEINTFRLRVPVTSDLSETRRTVSDLCPLSLNSPCSDTSS